MADQFFPTNFDAAPVMPVAATLYTIKATILNPDTRASIPAPDHVWLLVDVSGRAPIAVARSTPSDATGTSALGAPPSPRGRFNLLFFPAPDPAKTPAAAAAQIRTVYQQKREAWIDLDQPDRWAVEPTAGKLEPRRLFRVPAWSTARKAVLGGFKVAPPKTSIFARQGIIPAAELARFGPWDMPLDFNWAMARVEFSFVDWRQGQFDTLPRGLIVEALRTPKGGVTTRVAAGVTAATATGPFSPGGPPDRGAYLLLEGGKALWKDCHIHLSTPGACFIDLSMTPSSPDSRLKQGQSTQPRDDFNPLPIDWHSLGMRANFTTSPRPSGASPAGPAGAQSGRSPERIWDGLRFDIAKNKDGDNATISFNIDDIALCDQTATPLKQNPDPKTPLTLLDHLLAIIDPNVNAPYQSSTVRVGRIVPAPDALLPFIAGSPKAATARIKSTRLVHFDGGIHAVDNTRVTTAAGALGTVPCIGARAAIRGKDPNTVIANPLGGKFNVNERLQMHLIDVPEVKDPGTNIPLTHALIFLPVKLRVAQNLRSGSTLSDAQLLLNRAAELWSPGHPGVPPLTQASFAGPLPPTKRYALVPTNPTKRSLNIIRFRSFFPETTRSSPSLVVNHTRDSSPNRNTRASTTDGTATAVSHIDSTDSTVTADIGGTGGGPQGDVGDQFNSPVFTLAHELGHGVHNLNDEYVEIVRTDKLFQIGPLNPLLPAFIQLEEGTTDYRPYYSDRRSIMNTNRVPRLRHFWHHARNLAQRFTLPQPPYDLVHETFKSTPGTNPDGTPDAGTRIVYRTPQTNSRNPWIPLFFNRPITGGFGNLALFAIGEDEGTLEELFRTNNQPVIGLAKQNRMQGVLVVRSRICFIFDSATTVFERFLTIHTNFHANIYSPRYDLLLRFMLLTTLAPSVKGLPASPSELDRIAVLFQPHYSVNPADVSSADIVFDISKTAKPPRANPFQGTVKPARGGGPPRVRIMAADFNFEEAWRLIIGVQNAGPGPILTTHLDPLARVVETDLNEPANSRKVVTFA